MRPTLLLLSLLCHPSTAAHCEVVLYGDTPKGTATFSWKASFTEGTFSTFYYVKKARDNEASSIEVRGKGCFCKVFGGDLSGWSATFTEGVYLQPQFIAHNAIDNDVSSVIVGLVRRETRTTTLSVTERPSRMLSSSRRRWCRLRRRRRRHRPHRRRRPRRRPVEP